MGSAYQFHSWRVFVLVCAFPSVFAIGALTTQPESPRFFLEVTGAGSDGAPRLVCSDPPMGLAAPPCCAPVWGLPPSSGGAGRGTRAPVSRGV